MPGARNMPMSEQQEPSSVRVRIYDREYVLRTSGDPEKLKSLCVGLDKKMRELLYWRLSVLQTTCRELRTS
jgi:cell division protein ZapA (FtsZ GTPase activity inhibitor)